MDPAKIEHANRLAIILLELERANARKAILEREAISHESALIMLMEIEKKDIQFPVESLNKILKCDRRKKTFELVDATRCKNVDLTDTYCLNCPYRVCAKQDQYVLDCHVPVTDQPVCPECSKPIATGSTRTTADCSCGPTSKDAAQPASQTPLLDAGVFYDADGNQHLLITIEKQGSREKVPAGKAGDGSLNMHWCCDCRHSAKLADETPCLSCTDSSHWQPADQPAPMSPNDTTSNAFKRDTCETCTYKNLDDKSETCNACSHAWSAYGGKRAGDMQENRWKPAPWFKRMERIEHGQED